MRFLKEHVSCYKLIRNRFSQSFPSNQISDVRGALIRWWIEENFESRAYRGYWSWCQPMLPSSYCRRKQKHNWISVRLIDGLIIGKEEISRELVTFLNYLCKHWVQTIEEKVQSITFLKVPWFDVYTICFNFRFFYLIFFAIFHSNRLFFFKGIPWLFSVHEWFRWKHESLAMFYNNYEKNVHVLSHKIPTSADMYTKLLRAGNFDTFGFSECFKEHEIRGLISENVYD